MTKIHYARVNERQEIVLPAHVHDVCRAGQS